MPQEKETTSLLGVRRFAAKASRAPVPEPGRRTTGSFTSRSLPRRPSTSFSRSDHSSLRWLIMGPAPACLEQKGTSTGPGV
ncbi:MAG: hypothetical protein WC948_01045 [Thermovirgaceae bacterium]